MANVDIKRTLGMAAKYVRENKHMIAEITKGVEGFAAPLLLGIGEGRLANDGSGHIQMAGVPLNLALGAIGVGASASGVLDDYGTHVGNMACGLLGSYGADLGRQVGLSMRLAAGKPVQANLLPPLKEADIRAKALEKGVTLPPPATAKGVRIGEDFPNQYYSLGASPGGLTAGQLEQMVREAAAAVPQP